MSSSSTSYNRVLDALKSRSRQTSSIRLLLASDDPHDEEIIESLNKYQVAHFEVESIRSSADCLQALAKDRFDVLLLDDSLPDCGLTLLRQLTESAVEPPIVMLTAAANKNAALDAIQSGAYHYILKGSSDSMHLGRALHELLLRHHRQGEEKRAQAELDRLTIVDGLTGLRDSRFLDESLESECLRAQRHGGSPSLLIVDIDDFSECNDRYGHGAGDQMLRQVAALIGRSVRETDVAARRGGDRFGVLLPKTTNSGATQMAERLRFTVAAQGLTPGDKLEPMTISIGVYTPSTAEDLSPDVIIGGAEAALKEAKASGKNMVCGRTSAVANR